MKKLLTILISLMISIFFTACTREEDGSPTEELTLNEEVVILKGKTVIPLSADAKVRINKNSAKSTITVTLLQGSAKVQ